MEFGSRKILFGVLAVGVLLFAGYALKSVLISKLENPATGKARVAATIFPLYDIVSNVARGGVEVTLILAPGASPHLYEFSPGKLKELQGTRIIFAIGYGLDDWIVRAKDALGDTRIVQVDKGITLRNSVGGDEGPIDPHYWLNFQNAEKIADTVRDALISIDETHAEIYTQNAKAYRQELVRKEQELKEKLQNAPKKKILALHDAYYYFADNFGLEIAGSFEPSAGKEPTARDLRNLLKIIQENNITVIFAEPQISSTAFGNFAKDNDLKLGVLDPEGTAERKSFIEMMEYNVRSVIAAFGS